MASQVNGRSGRVQLQQGARGVVRLRGEMHAPIMPEHPRAARLFMTGHCCVAGRLPQVGTNGHLLTSFSGRLSVPTIERPADHSWRGLPPAPPRRPVHPSAAQQAAPRPRGLLDGDTAQTGGMRRFAAVSGRTVGSEKLWMGQTHVAPSTSSSDHHHGESETAIYVVSGHPEFVFVDDSGDGTDEVRLRTSPATTSSYRPTSRTARRNPDPAEEAVVVIARKHAGGDRGEPAEAVRARR